MECKSQNLNKVDTIAFIIGFWNCLFIVFLPQKTVNTFRPGAVLYLPLITHCYIPTPELRLACSSYSIHICHRKAYLFDYLFVYSTNKMNSYFHSTFCFLYRQSLLLLMRVESLSCFKKYARGSVCLFEACVFVCVWWVHAHARQSVGDVCVRATRTLSLIPATLIDAFRFFHPRISGEAAWEGQVWITCVKCFFFPYVN